MILVDGRTKRNTLGCTSCLFPSTFSLLGTVNFYSDNELVSNIKCKSKPNSIYNWAVGMQDIVVNTFPSRGSQTKLVLVPVVQAF